MHHRLRPGASGTYRIIAAGAVAALAGLTSRAVAQEPARKADTVSVTVSGVVFANYQYRLRPAGNVNRFDLERAYLTASGPLGARLGFRVTTDVFQQERDTVNRSWQVRAKYGYLQYEYSRNRDWPAWARLGLLQTVFIDHDESYWPRWISTVPTDRHGFFSSADGGLSTRIGLPARSGELYATITNGPGFGSREIDRFKDYAARLTITPFAGQPGNPLRSFAITGWGYRGALASRFAGGGTEQVGAVGESLRRDRWGVFTALAHPRLTASLQYARRLDEGELGANTIADPRVVTDSSGSIAAAYAIARPFPGMGRRLSLIARWDRVDLNRGIGRKHDLLIAGLAWRLSSRGDVALDFQGTYPDEGSLAAPSRTVFLHTHARF